MIASIQLVQRHLFDEPHARDVSTAAVLRNAGSDWKADAVAVVERMRGDEITGESIRVECESRGVTPHHHNAWGSFVLSLVRSGVLVPTGRYVPMRAKGSHARKTQVYIVSSNNSTAAD